MDNLTDTERAQLDDILARIGALPILQHLIDCTSAEDLKDAVDELVEQQP